MKEKAPVCKICNCNIMNQESRFYFPRLPQGHDLSDLSGVLHVNCIKSIDNKREIGKSLAEIAQYIACKSEVAPFVNRSGNIILRARLEEKRIEILNFEDFSEISIPISVLEKIQGLNILESINIGMQTIHVLEDGNLKIDSPLFTVCLSELNLIRLKELLKCPEIKTYFEDLRY